MENCAVLVSSCDKYSDAWDIFFYFFEKYWKDCPYKVYLMTNYKQYQRKGVITLTTNEMSYWSNELTIALDKIDSDIILYLQEDYFIMNHVNQTFLDNILNYMENNENIHYIRLYPCPGGNKKYDDNQYLDEISKNSYVRASLQTAFWRKNSLKTLLEKDETPWDFEIYASERTNNLDGYFLSVKKDFYPINYLCTAIISGKWSWDAKKMCNIESINIKEHSKRKIENFYEMIFRKLYNKSPLFLKKIIDYLKFLPDKLANAIKNSVLFSIYFNRKRLEFERKNFNRDLFEKRKSFFSSFLNKNDLIFDVGANFGNKTEIFLTLNCKVVAIEPQKICSRFLKFRFKNFYNKNLFLENVALGDKNEIKYLYYDNVGSVVASASPEWIDKVKRKRFRDINWKFKKKIRIVTLGEIIKKYGTPQYCKIDTEGYEYNILLGLDCPIDLLSFEFTFPERFDEMLNCIEYLSGKWNYRYNLILFENTNFEFSDWVSKEELIEYFNKLDKNTLIFGDIFSKKFNS